MNILSLDDDGLVATEIQAPAEALSGQFEASSPVRLAPGSGWQRLRVLPQPSLHPRSRALWAHLGELAQRWETAAFLVLAAAGLFAIVLAFF